MNNLIGSNLRVLRKAIGVTQEVAAKNLGILRPTYGAYEESRAEPPIHVLIQMCNYFDVSFDDLVVHDISKARYSDGRLTFLEY